MIVHICCSVDSHFFLKQLKKDFPNEDIVGFFYNPNIHPYSEYQLRLFDVEYSCKKLGIKLIKGTYDINNWFKIVKGFEKEPEKGSRCNICFNNRLNVTAQKTVELKHRSFTTTLLMSPLKSQEKIKQIGCNLTQKYKIQFVFKDYRSGQGMHLQAKEVKQNNIYRQNYCGCMFALNTQRNHQNRLCDELISPVNQQILPQSIWYRLKLYRQRNILEDNNKKYKIIKQKFLNYRLLNAKIIANKKVIPSYFLPYSVLKNGKLTGKIIFEKNDIYYFDKDGVKFISLKTFNKINNTNYKNIQELNTDPLDFDSEINCRFQLLHNYFDLSCLIVLDTILTTKIEVICDSKVYEDIKEKIIS